MDRDTDRDRPVLSLLEGRKASQEIYPRRITAFTTVISVYRWMYLLWAHQVGFVTISHDPIPDEMNLDWAICPMQFTSTLCIPVILRTLIAILLLVLTNY